MELDGDTQLFPLSLVGNSEDSFVGFIGQHGDIFIMFAIPESANPVIFTTPFVNVNDLAEVAFSGDYTDLSNIPDEQIFWATYGTTTASEIEAAMQSGKAVMCLYNNRLYSSVSLNDSTYINFYCPASTTINYLRIKKSDSTWAALSSGTFQTVSNLATSFGSTPSDTNYPSEKLVYDTLQDYALATGDNSYDFAANSIRLVYEPGLGTTLNASLTFALGRLHVSIPSGGALNTNKSVAFTDDIPTVPTISTNVVTDKASDTKTSSPKSVYDEIHPAIQSSQPAGGFLPNVIYNLGTLSGNTTFALATPADSSVANHYYWTFDTGSTAPTITWPSSITGWNGGSAPTINASKHYEISVLNGVGAFMEV